MSNKCCEKDKCGGHANRDLCGCPCHVPKEEEEGNIVWTPFTTQKEEGWSEKFDELLVKENWRVSDYENIKSFIREHFIPKERVEKVINSLPQDFCNDGAYTDKEMADCLAGVIKAQYSRFESLLSGDK